MKLSNFWIRTLTGILFLVIMVFGIIWDRAIFTCLFGIILTVALGEFYKMALGTRFRFQQRMGVMTGIAAFLLVAAYCFFGWDLRWLVISLIPLLLIPVSCLFLPSREGFGDLGYI
jgi:phosphatidate cytidylyltransferase